MIKDGFLLLSSPLPLYFGPGFHAAITFKQSLESQASGKKRLKFTMKLPPMQANDDDEDEYMYDDDDEDEDDDCAKGGKLS